MCLVALALEQHPRFPFVIASNRDEYFSRASAALAWWRAAPEGPSILGGRDLVAGGTWMGLTREGRLALVTNVRDPRRVIADAPSRGEIVADWLNTQDSPDDFWARTAAAGHNGFNLLAFDLPHRQRFWASNHAAQAMPLSRGVHGVSNAQLDTPWPKVVALKSRLADALRSEPASADRLASMIFEALSDPVEAKDDALPDTGIPFERERQLSSAFIRMPDSGYGTRCSTLVITERIGDGLVTQVIERSFAADGSIEATRQHTLEAWPPGRSFDSTD